jgi:lipopolysaccharide transport system ATP-binding protein
MGVGNYSISTALVDSEDHLSVNYEWVDLAYVFTVENRNRMPFVGGCWIEPEIKVIKS